MNRKYHGLHVLKFALCSGAAAACLVSQPVAAQESGLEDIVVTARKTTESLQRVPISIAATSGEELERRSLNSLSGLAEKTPNITFGQQAQGGRIGGLIFIRGVGQRDSLAVYDPGVGVYIDGVYLGRMNANDLDMMDIERTEILRGPQGTLFGKNTSGGAVNIVTRQPDASEGATSGKLQLTLGSRDRIDISGSVNLPIVVDKAALQVAGSRRRQDGFARRSDGEDMSDTHRDAIRAQLKLTPTEALSITVAGDWTKIDEKNAAYNLVAVNSNVLPIVLLNTFTPLTYDDRWLSPGPYQYNGGGPNSSRGTLKGLSFTLEYDLGGATLKSVTAYRRVKIHNDLDPDGSPINILDQYQTVRQRQFSQELQISGKSLEDRLQWVAGLYYFNEKVYDNTDYALLTALFGTSQSFSQENRVRNKSYAAYGQGTYNVTDKLRFTAGLRYTSDKKRVNFARYTFPEDVVLTPLQIGRHNSTALSPRIGIDYQWTPDVMTYVSVAQGAKNGGYNGRANSVSDFTEFDDERVWTYEAGLRTEFLNGSGRFNATAFYSRYSDLQVQMGGSTIVNNAPQPFNVITNVPRATIKGGEAELTIMPVPGLTLNGSLGLTYAEYTRLPTDPAFLASGVITRDSKFMNAPKVTYALGAEYGQSIGGGLNASGRVDYSHRSRIHYNVENTAALIQKSYGLLNARLTLEHEASGTSLAVYGTNLTNRHYIVGGFDDAGTPNPAFGFTVVNEGAPREYGVTATVKF